MEAAEMILPQFAVRIPHVTKRILELACPTFADLTRLRRVSKAWKNFIDSEFLQKTQNQKAIRKEKIMMHPWMKGQWQVIKIDIDSPLGWGYIVLIDEDSFYWMPNMKDNLRVLTIIFKEQKIGSLTLRYRYGIKCLIQIEQAQRLMILMEKYQLSEWTLNTSTGQYDNSRQIKEFSPDQHPYLGVMLGQPFVVWTTEAEIRWKPSQFTFHCIENSASSVIELPACAFKITMIHFYDKRAFVNMERTNYMGVDSFPSRCVVVADFQDEVHQAPSLRIIANFQSLNSSSRYLIGVTENEVEIIDKSTLLPIARVTRLEAPDLFKSSFPPV